MPEETKLHDISAPKNEQIVRVREVMEPVYLSVSPDMTVREVFALFIKHRLMAAPVVDEHDHLVGLISSADFLYRKSKAPIQARSLPFIGQKIFTSQINHHVHAFKKLLDQPCTKLMTKDVMITTPEADVEQVAAVMILEHLKVLPVIENKRVVGIIHRGCILKQMYKEKTLKEEKE